MKSTSSSFQIYHQELWCKSFYATLSFISVFSGYINEIWMWGDRQMNMDRWMKERKARREANRDSTLTTINCMSSGPENWTGATAGMILKLLCVYTGIEQLSKWITDGRSQVLHCWSGHLQTWRSNQNDHVVMDSSRSHQQQLLLRLPEMDTWTNIYGWGVAWILCKYYISLSLSARKTQN